jgi:hypothetical protein
MLTFFSNEFANDSQIAVIIIALSTNFVLSQLHEEELIFCLIFSTIFVKLVEKYSIVFKKYSS